nr:MAG TPA: catechol oxidase [Caudoviricetes sp.]
MKFGEWQTLSKEQQKAYFEAYKKAATCSNK